MSPISACTGVLALDDAGSPWGRALHLSWAWLDKAKFDSFLSDFLAAILSGIVLTFLFFLLREWWHPQPSIRGRWYFETHTTKSTLNKFVNIRIKYEAMIWQQGSILTGTTEKIFEDNIEESFEYDNDKRVHGDMQGYIDRFYLRKNCVTLHLVEYGRKRKSSGIFDLAMQGDLLVGTFHSTAGSTSGTVVGSQDQHSDSFSELVRDQLATIKAPRVEGAANSS